jgi:hypothetical protein
LSVGLYLAYHDKRREDTYRERSTINH